MAECHPKAELRDAWREEYKDVVLELSRKPYAAPAKQPPSPFQDALGACVHMDGEEWAAQCVGGSAHEFASEVTVRFLHYDHTIIPGFDQFLVRGAHPSFASFRKSRRASPEPELAPPPLPAPPSNHRSILMIWCTKRDASDLKIGKREIHNAFVGSTAGHVTRRCAPKEWHTSIFVACVQDIPPVTMEVA